MRVIGVVDLAGGQAVHALAGQRKEYQPVRSVGGHPITPGDAVALAGSYLDEFGLEELYVADLDAILDGRPQSGVVRKLTSMGVPLWLDAGVSTTDMARQALELGATYVVVGLETLASWPALNTICQQVSPAHVAFSLDLYDGLPVVRPQSEIPSDRTPPELAARAVDAGVSSVIVIDLKRVGTNRGPDFSVIGNVRQAAPGIPLIAGGGVRDLDDLQRLGRTGCDGVLVATLLQLGCIGAAELAAIQGF